MDASDDQQYEEPVDPDADVRELEQRNDAGRSLFELLDNENLNVAELVRLKQAFEEEGMWKWKRTARLERLLALESGAPVDAPRRAAPHRCSWRGKDDVGNVWRCSNPRLESRSRHGSAGGLAQRGTKCAFHTTCCVRAHPPGHDSLYHTAIDVPNSAALCSTHFQAEYGHLPDPTVNEFLVPGVVFQKWGTIRHPLAPASDLDTLAARSKLVRGFVAPAADLGQPVELNANEPTGSSGADELGPASSSKAAAILARAKRALQRVRLPDRASIDRVSAAAKLQILRLLGKAPGRRELAAVSIQALVRGWLVRLRVPRLLRAAVVRRRAAAATCLCRTIRGHLAKQRTRAHVQRQWQAALLIQRSFRYWRIRVRRAQAARLYSAVARVQHWFRVKRVRAMLRMLSTRTTARAAGMLREEAVYTIRHMVHTFLFRRGIAAAFHRQRRRRLAATMLQAAWRAYTVRSTSGAAWARRRATLNGTWATIALQRALRRHVARCTARGERAVLLRAAATLNRYARGFLGRTAARARRAQLEAVWTWLAPTMPREHYYALLDAPDYDALFGLRSTTFIATTASTATTGSAVPSVERMHAPQVPPCDGNGGRGTDGLDSVDGCCATGTLEEPVHASAATALPTHSTRESTCSDSTTLRRSDSGDGRYTDAPASARSGCALSAVDGDDTPRAHMRTSGGSGSPSATARNPSMISHPTPSAATASPPTQRLPNRAVDSTAVLHTQQQQQQQRLQAAAHRARGLRLLPIGAAVDAATAGTEVEYCRLQVALEEVAAQCRAVDAVGCGVISPRVFKRIFNSSPSASQPLPAIQFSKLASSFTVLRGGVDQFDYPLFVRTAKRLRQLCELHGVALCPACTFVGPCEASPCGCKKYERGTAAATVDLRTSLHAQLCRCGHHSRRHIPALFASIVSDSTAAAPHSGGGATASASQSELDIAAALAEARSISNPQGSGSQRVATLTTRRRAPEGEGGAPPLEGPRLWKNLPGLPAIRDKPALTVPRGLTQEVDVLVAAEKQALMTKLMARAEAVAHDSGEYNSSRSRTSSSSKAFAAACATDIGEEFGSDNMPRGIEGGIPATLTSHVSATGDTSRIQCMGDDVVRALHLLMSENPALSATGSRSREPLPSISNALRLLPLPTMKEALDTLRGIVSAARATTVSVERLSALSQQRDITQHAASVKAFEASMPSRLSSMATRTAHAANVLADYDAVGVALSHGAGGLNRPRAPLLLANGKPAPRTARSPALVAIERAQQQAAH